MLLLIVITIAYGGTFVLSVTRGKGPGQRPAAEVLPGRLRPRRGAGHPRPACPDTGAVQPRPGAPSPAISFGILAAALLMPSGLFISAISEGCRSYWDADPALSVLSDRPIRGPSRPRNECSGPYPDNPRRRAKAELATACRTAPLPSASERSDQPMNTRQSDTRWCQYRPRPVVTRRSAARYRHWPFRRCSSPVTQTATRHQQPEQPNR